MNRRRGSEESSGSVVECYVGSGSKRWLVRDSLETVCVKSLRVFKALYLLLCTYSTSGFNPGRR